MNNRPDRKLETLAGGGAFFESPRWHEGRLWVSDYWRYQVVAVAPDGTTQTIAEVPGSPSGLGWLPDGTLLVISMRDRKLLRIEDGTITQHADLSPQPGPQSNDMVIDAAGRACVSRRRTRIGRNSGILVGAPRIHRSTRRGKADILEECNIARSGCQFSRVWHCRSHACDAVSLGWAALADLAAGIDRGLRCRVDNLVAAPGRQTCPG
jgi:hypothetical protein